MILKVGRFKEGSPEHVEAAYDPAALDLDFVDLHYVGTIAVNGVAEKIKQTLTFRGILTSHIEQVCARCLEQVPSGVSTPFDLCYEVEGRETIDPADDLRGLLILGHPDRFLCRTDCRGICSHCGANLNRVSCGCVPSERESGSWSALKDWLKKEA